MFHDRERAARVVVSQALLFDIADYLDSKFARPRIPPR
jgi:hypothetical protein